ncbi:acetolactate decarboxylase, partial [Streptococcus suis]
MQVNRLFQYNTLGALMAGLYGGSLTVGELLEHGDLGLGTLDSIDGELIVLDG